MEVLERAEVLGLEAGDLRGAAAVKERVVVRERGVVRVKGVGLVALWALMARLGDLEEGVRDHLAVLAGWEVAEVFEVMVRWWEWEKEEA